MARERLQKFSKLNVNDRIKITKATPLNFDLKGARGKVAWFNDIGQPYVFFEPKNEGENAPSPRYIFGERFVRIQSAKRNSVHVPGLDVNPNQQENNDDD